MQFKMNEDFHGYDLGFLDEFSFETNDVYGEDEERIDNMILEEKVELHSDGSGSF